jgi:hypothetical protein
LYVFNDTHSIAIRRIYLQNNALLEDEAAEEEEEGAQAGLGDFGFGVTSNIREHDEEQVRARELAAE